MGPREGCYGVVGSVAPGRSSLVIDDKATARLVAEYPAAETQQMRRPLSFSSSSPGVLRSVDRMQCCASRWTVPFSYIIRKVGVRPEH